MIKVRPYNKSKRQGWEVDLRFDWPDGTSFRGRYRAPVNTELQARRWGEAKERELFARGKPLAPLPKDAIPTLEEAFPRFLREHCEANRHKPSGIARKRNAFDVWMLPLLGSKKLDEIGVEDVIALKAKLAHRSPKSANNVLTALSACLKFFGPEGLRGSPGLGIITKVPRVPLLRVSQGEPSWYEAHDYERLKTAARKLGGDVYLLVLLGGDAGLRRGEILSLKWTDLDLARRLIHVQRSVWTPTSLVSAEGLPKSGKGRKVTMTKELHAALTQHRHLRGERVILPTPTNWVVKQWLKRAQRAAGLEQTGKVHQLRHTFCSRLATAGVPVGVIKELAGHQSIATTMRYMHLSPTNLEHAIALLDRAAPSVQSGETLEKSAVS